MRSTLHSLTLALTALLLIPLASCGKDKPTPPDPQPAKREDIIGKVRTITMKMLDDKSEVTQRALFTFNKQLQQTALILEDYVDGKFVLDTEVEYTYDASGHLILQKSLSYERDSEGTLKPPSKSQDSYTYDQKGRLKQHESQQFNGSWITRTTYYYDADNRKKSAYIYRHNPVQSKQEYYHSYSYEGEVEIESVYTDREKTNRTECSRRIYDEQGRETRHERIQYMDVPRNYGEEDKDTKQAYKTTITETHYGIFGELLHNETTEYNAKKEVTSHSLYQIRYTKYNSLGLPVAGIQTEWQRQQSFTIEYTFY
jgi:hypothetical protein